MSLAIVHSRAQVGVEAPAVTVEAHLANGLPALTLVGLPEGAVKESKDRVRSTILNSGLDFPARRITLNLAPADLPKDGGYRLVTGMVSTQISSVHGHGHCDGVLVWCFTSTNENMVYAHLKPTRES
ncbi:Mg chelatase-related protein [Pseudomonas syringae pv. aptata]|uniref:Mg chelatase-related protein n=2 Tax=Pseudomonas syringae TaxID=317 RepID=A0A3M5XAE0_PSEAP|nr:Mg chelatase-related protein [Pseudomonas syringae pv. aptata]RMV57453.1 Mg chelatase-related protein [Pseudomonas syringae pv. pisi]